MNRLGCIDCKLDEMSKLEKADPKPTIAVVKANYGLDSFKATDKEDIAEVLVKQGNNKHSSYVKLAKLVSAKLIKISD